MKGATSGLFVFALSVCLAAEAADPLKPPQSAIPGKQPAAKPPLLPPGSVPATEWKKPAGLPQRAPAQPLSAPASAPPPRANPIASPGPSLAVPAATAQNQAVNPEVLALRTTSDLVIKDLAFTALGEVTFELVNRGEIGVNAPNGPSASVDPMKMVRQTAPGAPIAIDVYIGSGKVSIQQASLAGKQAKTFTVPIPSNIPKPRCLDARNLKVVVDPQNQIQEFSDDNNVTEASSARPCPDLAIKSIKRDYDGLLNETYRVKVTIVNQGNAPSPSNQVWATSLPGGVWPVTGWPELVPTHTLKALAPGEETSFKVGGSVLSANKTAVRVVLDRDQKVEESDEGNNFKDDRL